jgi:hypothetical protein
MGTFHALRCNFCRDVSCRVINRLYSYLCVIVRSLRYQLLLLGHPRLMAVSALLSEVRVQE